MEIEVNSSRSSTLKGSTIIVHSDPYFLYFFLLSIFFDLIFLFYDIIS